MKATRRFKAAWLKRQDPWRRGVVSGRRGCRGGVEALLLV